MEAGDPAFWKMLLDRVWPARVELSAESESVVEFRWAGQEPTAQSQLLISRKGDQ
jgi:hypothetical protein